MDNSAILYLAQMGPARQVPQVRPDPGFLLVMSQEEIRSCAYRIYYAGCQVIIKAFHALTNLAPVALSAPLRSYISRIEVHLMPRCTSPYNCALLSCGETTQISITRMVAIDTLETLFFEKLHEVLAHS